MEEVAVERIGRYVIWLKCRGASDYSSCRLENEDILTRLPYFLPNLRTLTLTWPFGRLSTLHMAIDEAPYQSVPTLTRLEAVHLRCNGRRGPHGVQLDLMEAVSALPSLKLLTITSSNTDNLKHSLISPMNFNVVKLDLWHC